MHSPKNTNFSPTISYYKDQPNPQYFNYGQKKSFIENPTQQQEMLEKLSPEGTKENFKPIKVIKKKNKIFINQNDWDDASHFNTSNYNAKNHEFKREYFDKKSGETQFKSVMKYNYRTPSNGTKEFT